MPAPPPAAQPRLGLAFVLVVVAFTTIYRPQLVLPVLQQEFGLSPTLALLSVSAVVLGLALSQSALWPGSPTAAGAPHPVWPPIWAKSLPLERLNVAMDFYCLGHTVAGGLMGRLLGGWLPPEPPARRDERQEDGLRQLLLRPELLRNYLVAFGAFFVFPSIFNYLPFYISGPPFSVSTQFITLLYL